MHNASIQIYLIPKALVMMIASRKVAGNWPRGGPVRNDCSVVDVSVKVVWPPQQYESAVYAPSFPSPLTNFGFILSVSMNLVGNSDNLVL